MGDDKRVMQVDDLYQIIKIEEPQISPDGRWVAYVRVTVDKMGNTYKRSIWISELAAGSKPRQLTRGDNDMQPRWSPDGGALAFTSVRGDKPQIYLLPLGALGGEARPLTSQPNGATSAEWSPDGATIAFLSASNAEEREKEDSTEKPEAPKDVIEAKHRKERQEDDEKKRQDPYRMWRIPYRVGTQFLTGRYAQVYVIATDENLESDAAKPRRLTHIDASYQGCKWSPDGKYLFTARHVDEKADEQFDKNGLYRLEVATGEETRISGEGYSYYAPIPSPDGKWLAFGRTPAGNRGDLEAIVRLSVMPIEGGDIRDLNLTLDRSLENFHWAGDSTSIYFSAGDWGDIPVYNVGVAGGDVTTVARGLYQVSGLDVHSDGTLAATVSTPTNPSTLVLFPAGSDEKIVLADFNAEWLKDVIVQETHEIRFKSPSGTELQGWYILPTGYEAGQKYPLALNIHGGPRFMWGPSEASMFHEWQFHAARGYVVFYCNPRGAMGYGEQFQRDLHAAWGDVAMPDILAGVEAVLEKGFVDADRMAITGGSYGGYMTAWMVGKDHRFKAAVTQRGVYNLVSFYGTSDIPILITSDYGVEPWEDHEFLWKHSPLAYAHNIKTPLLILHSENDYRVPIEQAEQLFAWVRRATDTPVEMWRYPRDGHELSRSGEPEHRVSRLTKMVEWFDKYC